MAQFSRGMSVPPNGWPQMQLEELQLELAQDAMKNIRLDPDIKARLDAGEFSVEQRKQLQARIYRMLYGNAKDVTDRGEDSMSQAERHEAKMEIYKALYCTDFDKLIETVNNQDS